MYKTRRTFNANRRKFKYISEKHERTIAEFLVQELVKSNLDFGLAGKDVYFTKFGNNITLGFSNILGAYFEYKNGEIGINLPSYNSNKDIPFNIYNKYLQSMNTFLIKLNRLITKIRNDEYTQPYDPSMLKDLEQKYGKYM